MPIQCAAWSVIVRILTVRPGGDAPGQRRNLRHEQIFGNRSLPWGATLRHQPPDSLFVLCRNHRAEVIQLFTKASIAEIRSCGAVRDLHHAAAQPMEKRTNH
jgi:hypothetical protein